MTKSHDVAAPLDGVTVIEIGHSVAAPYAGQILADLGATVYKVENPKGGDDARVWGPPFWHGVAATFQALNRNKQSVIVDLKDEADRLALKKLIAQSDVLLQNMRPGLLDSFGFGAEATRALNSRLIHCNLGAFGDIGPMKASTGYDPLVQAFSGIMSVTGEPERPPIRVGPSVIDQGTGMWCAMGIITALLTREKTGEGCTVDASLFETALAWMTVPIVNSLASGKDGVKSGSETPMLVPYRAFMSADRYIVIAAGNNNLFRRLATVLDRPEWAEDPRFRDNADRVANREVLNALIEDGVGKRPAAEWLVKLEAVGVPCALVQTVKEVLAHPQTKAMDVVQDTPDERMSLVATPLRFNGQRPRINHGAPDLGSTSLHDLIGPGD
ncbi:CoA transferase [Pseudooceanicola sp.]|uniref:CaiB/BaiF CoA transferase family protein n=1 Tax=Pseudooceanicola sp. TaxID=1914328 RepID=UPI0026108EF2|nr:CoA transferase [Pseudooceanicola sp.]MDF1857184.1 CoA transferase [Pseudooceanicola sp.]